MSQKKMVGTDEPEDVDRPIEPKMYEVEMSQKFVSAGIP